VVHSREIRRHWTQAIKPVVSKELDAGKTIELVSFTIPFGRSWNGRRRSGDGPGFGPRLGIERRSIPARSDQERSGGFLVEVRAARGRQRRTIATCAPECECIEKQPESERAERSRPWHGFVPVGDCRVLAQRRSSVQGRVGSTSQTFLSQTYGCGQDDMGRKLVRRGLEVAA